MPYYESVFIARPDISSAQVDGLVEPELVSVDSPPSDFEFRAGPCKAEVEVDSQAVSPTGKGGGSGKGRIKSVNGTGCITEHTVNTHRVLFKVSQLGR